MLKIFLLILLSYSNASVASHCSSYLEDQGKGQKEIVKVYLKSTMMFPLSRRITNIALASHFFLHRNTTDFVNVIKYNNPEVLKIVNVAVAAHKKFQGPDTPPESIISQFRTFITNIVGTYGIVENTVFALLGKQAPEDWTFWQGTRTVQEILSDPQYAVSLVKLEKYAKTIQETLNSEAISEISKTHFPINGLSKNRHKVDLLVIDVIVQKLLSLYPELHATSESNSLSQAELIVRYMSYHPHDSF